MSDMFGNKTIGVRWSEFNKRNEAVVKEKFFDTKEQLDRFVTKLEEKPNFWRFEAWLGM